MTRSFAPPPHHRAWPTILALALVWAMSPASAPGASAQSGTPTATAPAPNQQPTNTATVPLPPTETPRPSDTPRPSPTTRPGPFPTSPFPTLGPPPTATPKPSETPVDEGLPREERPIIVINGYEVDPQRPSPDSQFHLKLNVANEGEHDAENVQIVLGGESFIPVAPGGVLFINRLKDGDDTTVEADLIVAGGVEAGTHPLNLSLRWDDSYGGTYTDQQSIGIEVSGPGTRRPLLSLVSSRIPGRVAPGAPFTVLLELLNSGGSEARNVVVVPTGGPLALQGSGGSPPATIGAGARASVALRVQAGQVADPGAVSQTLELRYDDPNGQHYTDQVTVGLAVTDDAAYGPLPLVLGYSVQPDELHPGQVFELVLQITNVGLVDAVRTRLSIGGAGPSGGGTGAAAASSSGVFAPLTTSNVRYLDRLKVDETREVRQKMVVDGNAKPGNYTLNLAFVYFDADGKAQESSEVVSLLVTRPVVLQINSTAVITEAIVGDVIPLNLEILNAGLATVNGINVDVKTSSRLGVVEGAPHFVGSLDAGSPDTAEIQLEAKEEGQAEATVVVDYLDDQNRSQRVEKTFNFVITKPPVETLDESAAPPDEGNVFIRIIKGFLGLGASPSFAPRFETIEGDAESGAGTSSGRRPAGGGRVIVRPAPAVRAR